MDDVALNKAAVIERCIRRVREVFADDLRNLQQDLTRQDSIILNIQRACEAAIDLAMHIVRDNKLGIPQDSGTLSICCLLPGYTLPRRVRSCGGWSAFATWPCTTTRP